MSPSQSPSSNFDNQEVHQRLIDDREFKVIEDNDQQVILTKAEGNPVTPPTNRGPSSFPTPPSGGRPSRSVYVPKYRIAPKLVDQGLGAAANPAGAGDGDGAAELEDQCPASKSETSTYDYRSSSKKKKKSQDQCSIDEQNKAGIDELPDSSEFIYNLETKTAKKALKKVWKNPEARKEVLAGLADMDSGELLPRNEKNFKSFKELKEIKLNDTRMLVKPGQKGAPDEIVVIFMKNDMAKVEKNLKNVYK